MLKINLAPEIQEKKEKIREVTTYALVGGIGFVVLVGVILGGAGIFLGVRKLSLNTAEKKISDTKESLKEYSGLEQEVVSLEKGLEGAKAIISSDSRWSDFLTHIEKSTPNDVKYSRLKINASGVEADLNGETINALARYYESIKKYTVVTIKGTVPRDKEVLINVDGAEYTKVRPKPSGKFVFSVPITEGQDKKVSVLVDSQELFSASYIGSSKSIEKSNNDYTADLGKLFSGLEIREYTREDKGFKFSAKFTFNKDLLW
jgi:hypothetical protein